MLIKIAYVELTVGNIVQSSFYFEQALGFTRVGYAGLETGEKRAVSVLMRQNDIFLILSSGLNDESEVSRHVSQHGDSIKHIAFISHHPESEYARINELGISCIDDEFARKSFCIFGETTHSFLQDLNELERRFSVSLSDQITGAGFLLEKIDHIAICVNTGSIERYIPFYLNAFDFQITHTEQVDTGKGGMDSKVLQNQSKSIKLVFVEPLAKYKTSQLSEFIRYYRGEGVQHLAYATSDIRISASKIRAQGVSFLKVPKSYYEERLQSLPDLSNTINLCSDLDILVDRDEDGNLYQTFSHPIQTKPTCFFELVERLGNQGFGSDNIKALFRAIEREQVKRGTL